VGMDFLGRQIFRYDPDRGEVVFLSSLPSDLGRRAPLRVESGVPTVDVRIPGLNDPEPFVVTTGFGGFVSGGLRGQAYEALSKSGNIEQASPVFSVTLSGTVRARQGRLRSILCAGYENKNLLFEEYGNDSNKLNLNYWSRYVSTFDFAGGAVYVKKANRFALPDSEDNSGMKVLRTGGRTVVKFVQEQSPAASAGVRPEDAVVSVEGERVDRIQLMGLRRKLCAEGKQIRLVLSRDGAEWEVNLTLPNRPARVPAAN
jgi:hypothetical protein